MILLKFCTHCGKEIADEAVVCPSCGYSQVGHKKAQTPTSSSNTSYIIASVFLPLFGILYWILNVKTQPKRAELCGLTAFVSITVSYIFSFIFNFLMNFIATGSLDYAFNQFLK